jgi:hypothetical protein
LERYSFPDDLGRYGSPLEEIEARFPIAKWYPTPDGGFTNSVFFPVDNMARYWYDRYIAEGDPLMVGWFVHAIQDCSVPHHAAGAIGSHHAKYEGDLNARLVECYDDESFKEAVRSRYRTFTGHGDDPPTSIGMEDLDLTPRTNWRIDMLATWMAFHAFREFQDTYDYFKGSYWRDGESMRGLTELAVAMSMLVMVKADRDAG